MKVILAGYNLDTEVIESLKRACLPGGMGEKNQTSVTPEVLSASYARISRDPRPIDELRAVARTEVEKARKSNQAIIFKMGHHSVAEHAVFNFDIIDVSRFAMEEIEKFRLCSYTEKSQRYQKLEDNFIVPDEIKNAGFSKLFTDTINIQNRFYQQAVEAGVPPEDARYATSFATLGQLGLTINARNLELMFRRFASCQYEEVRRLGVEMYNQVKDIAPSIILFTNPTPLDRDTYPELKAKAKGVGVGKGKTKDVELVDFSKNGDNLLVAAFLHTSTNLSYKECAGAAKKLSKKKKLELVETSLKNMEFFDTNIREYEYPDLTYEISLSAACFGQLKRHRMATLTCQQYDPNLGITIPGTIIEKGLEKEFKKIIKATEQAYLQIFKKSKDAAQYVLTNAHKKKVLFKCNARELYHISRLREDKHAQWDIQNISRKMSILAQSVMPLTMLTIGGKDSYPEIYEKVFGKKPKMNPIY